MEIDFKTKIPSYYIVPDGKGTWISERKLVVYSERLGFSFEIPAGTKSDLASIPRAARSLIPANGPHRIAAVVHDYLYEKKGFIPESKLRIKRKDADGVFLDAMKMQKRHVLSSFDSYLFNTLLSKYPKIFHSMNNSKKIVNFAKRNLMHKAVVAGGWVHWIKK